MAIKQFSERWCSWKVPLQSISPCDGDPVCKDKAPPVPPPHHLYHGQKSSPGLGPCCSSQPQHRMKIQVLPSGRGPNPLSFYPYECLLELPTAPTPSQRGEYCISPSFDDLRRSIMDDPPLEMFQARLDGSLSNLIWLKMSLAIAGGLD